MTLSKRIALLLLLLCLLPVQLVRASPGADDAAPSVVRVTQADNGHWEYLVDDTPTYLVGMGYNPMYRNLPDADRAARYDRDFTLMRSAGVNTITGWDSDKGYQQDHFDGLTLDAAQRFGLGVIMPVYLPPKGDYSDPNFVAGLAPLLTAKVEQYRDYPALRMWGLGNEVLSVMPAQNHTAFLQAYLQLADLIHQLDPNHPVIYRESEDTYVPELQAALAVDGQPRPWLLYGMNLYNTTYEQLLDDWPGVWPGQPLFVSEFGPPTWADQASRSLWYTTIWRAIGWHSAYVLGGAAYVWMAPGPEPVDNFYGLVDQNAQPRDGALAALAALFQNTKIEP